jgi:hypothetical protein
METSEGVKTALRQQAEAGVLKLLERLETLKERDLKGLDRRWSGLDLAPGSRTLSRGRTNRRQLACPRTCLEGGSSGLWVKHA